MKALTDMSLEELWRLFPIILIEHRQEWKYWAEEEIKFLRETLAPVPSEIHHIGSTAIEGIKSKPIIDIIVALNDMASFACVKCKLLEAGYICMSETDTRISFNKGYTLNGYAERVFHLHLRTKDDVDEIYFRDYLNSHDDIARQYESLKLSLWKKYEYDRDSYTQAKSTFVLHYTQLAKQLLGSSRDFRGANHQQKQHRFC